MQCTVAKYFSHFKAEATSFLGLSYYKRNLIDFFMFQRTLPYQFELIIIVLLCSFSACEMWGKVWILEVKKPWNHEWNIADSQCCRWLVLHHNAVLNFYVDNVNLVNSGLQRTASWVQQLLLGACLWQGNRRNLRLGSHFYHVPPNLSVLEVSKAEKTMPKWREILVGFTQIRPSSGGLSESCSLYRFTHLSHGWAFSSLETIHTMSTSMRYEIATKVIKHLKKPTKCSIFGLFNSICHLQFLGSLLRISRWRGQHHVGDSREIDKIQLLVSIFNYRLII